MKKKAKKKNYINGQNAGYKRGYKEGWNAAIDDIVSRCPLPNCFDCKDLKALKIKEEK